MWATGSMDTLWLILMYTRGNRAQEAAPLPGRLWLSRGVAVAVQRSTAYKVESANRW
jgi:hypothetical protein